MGGVARVLLGLAGLLVRAARATTRASLAPPTRRHRPGAAAIIEGQHLKLHLGCGPVHVQGFVNVDIDPELPTVDVVDDVGDLQRFPYGSAALIYACHVLEHCSHADVTAILRRWFEVLEPGGEVRISVPDIDRIVTIYSSHRQHFQTPGHSPWIGLIYGGQLTPYDYHKTGFNFVWMKHLLDTTGFVNVQEYPHEPHWLAVRDASLAKEPFGEFVSLNVRARKPVGGKSEGAGATGSSGGR